MKKIFLFYVSIALLLSSCLIQRKVVVKFSPVENENTISPALKALLKANPNPSIVLRTPNVTSSTTEIQSGINNQIYSTIEKSLMQNGFVVRDRALFNDVFVKILNSDYLKIHETTKTDLILELVSLNLNVEYTTNKYLNRAGQENIFGCGSVYSFTGASIEFRLISIKDNEFVGTIKINYAPCTNGCNYIFKQDILFGDCNLYDEKKKLVNPGAFESVESSQLENLITISMNQFINELKK